MKLFAAGSDEVEDVGINIERLGIVDDRAGFESFALIPNSLAESWARLLLSVLDINPPNQEPAMRNIAQPCAICQQNLSFALDKESLTACARVANAFDAMQNARSENKLRGARGFKNAKYNLAIKWLCEARFSYAECRAANCA